MKTAVMISAVVMAVIMAVLLGLILYRVKKDTSIISQLRKQINGHDYGRLTALLVKSGMADKINHISTGGGASLEFMDGRVLPGLAIIEEREDQ